jgi:hypothetical protein
MSLTLYVLKSRDGWYLGRSGGTGRVLKSAKTFSGLGPAKVSRNSWNSFSSTKMHIVELNVTEGKVVE